MNQQMQQKQILEQRMLGKTNFEVANKRIRRSQCKESKNICMVASYLTSKKWYVVRWNEELDVFICVCKPSQPVAAFTSLLRTHIYLQAKKFESE